MKKALILSLIFIAGISSASAQVGTDGMSFLKLGVGGRALGMGEAYSASAGDPTATYYNPAALTLSDRSQLLLMHKSWIQDTRTEYLAGQSSLGPVHLGLSVNSTSVDEIEFRSIPGPAEGTFSARNSAVGLSAAFAFDSTLSFGVTANFLYEKVFVNEATGTGYNIGALYVSPWDVTFGASVNNLGSMKPLDLAATELPTSIRFGAAHTKDIESLQSTVTLAADIVSYTKEQKTHLHAGAELFYQKTFAVRLGYLTGYDARSITAGAGVRYGLLNFDYAFAPFRYDLGSTHTISLGFLL